MAFGSLYWLAPKPRLAALAASTKVNFFPRLWQQAFPQLLWLMTKNHAQTWLNGVLQHNDPKLSTCSSLAGKANIGAKHGLQQMH